MLGQLLFFMFGLVGLVVIGLVTLSYAAHGYLAIVEDTAAGCDDVRWPDDSPSDWLWKSFYLGWLWAMPATSCWLVLVICAPELAQSPIGILLISFGSLWLLFPVAVLSSMAGRSRLFLFHWGMLVGLARHFLSTAVFYFFTGLLVAAFAALIVWGILARSWANFPIAVPIMVAILFIHARLLGRIGWLVSRQPGMKPKQLRAKKARPLDSVDPWEIPEAQELPPPLPPVASTHVMAGDPRLPLSQAIQVGPSPIVANTEEEEDEWAPNKKPYALSDDPSWQPTHAEMASLNPDESIPAGPPPPKSPIPELDKVFPVDERFLVSRELPPPRYLFFSNVWNFPAYGNSLRSFINLTLLGLLTAFLVRLVLATSPA